MRIGVPRGVISVVGVQYVANSKLPSDTDLFRQFASVRMPAIRLSCPRCGQPSQFDATPSQAGQPVRCPHCQKAMLLPEIPPQSPTVTAPPRPAQSGASVAPSPESLADASQKATALRCPHCGKLFRIHSDMAGQQVACPHCRTTVTAPASAASTKPDASAKLSKPFEKPPPTESSDTAPVIVTDQSRSGTTPSAPKSELEVAQEGAPVTTKFTLPDGEEVTLREDVTTVHTVAGDYEIRNLTLEEKRRRRIRRNIVMFGICSVLLLITAAILIGRG